MRTGLIFTLSMLMCFDLVSCASKRKHAAYLAPSEKLVQGEVKLDIVRETLPNGMTVILVENHRLPIFAYYTFYKVGGRHEVPGLIGGSHLLEHLMFKGTKKYSMGTFDKLVENSGGSSNAFTTPDITVYYVKLPISMLDTMIDIETDRMKNLVIENNSFEQERKVVLEERKFRYDNNPRALLHMTVNDNIFEQTPYGRSVIGTSSDIKGLNRESILDYYNNFYSPNNAVLVIVGDIKSNELMAKIKNTYGKIPASPKLAETKRKVEDDALFVSRARMNREIKVKGDSPVPLFAIVFEGAKVGDPDNYEKDFLAQILAGNDSSYWTQKYVKGAKPLLTSLGAWSENMQKSGIFEISGELKRGVNFDEFKKEFMADFNGICEKTITDREIQKLKNQLMSGYYRSFETNSELAQLLGNKEVFWGSALAYNDDVYRYQQIKAADVLRVCKNIFYQKKPIVVSVWDKYKAGKKSKNIKKKI